MSDDTTAAPNPNRIPKKPYAEWPRYRHPVLRMLFRNTLPPEDQVIFAQPAPEIDADAPKEERDLVKAQGRRKVVLERAFQTWAAKQHEAAKEARAAARLEHARALEVLAQQAAPQLEAPRDAETEAAPPPADPPPPSTVVTLKDAMKAGG